MRADSMMKLLSAVAVAAIVLVGPACGTKPGPEGAVSGFLDGAKNGNQDSVLQAVSLESLFPVYDGERVDLEKTKAVCTEYKAQLAQFLAQRDKTFWGDAQKEVGPAVRNEDGTATVTVRSASGARAANFILREPGGSKGRFVIVGIFYQGSNPG